MNSLLYNDVRPVSYQPVLEIYLMAWTWTCEKIASGQKMFISIS